MFVSYYHHKFLSAITTTTTITTSTATTTTTIITITTNNSISTTTSIKLRHNHCYYASNQLVEVVKLSLPLQYLRSPCGIDQQDDSEASVTTPLSPLLSWPALAGLPTFI